MTSATPAYEVYFRRRARALALLYVNGELTPDELRSQVQQALEVAVTAALLSGTGGQHNGPVDAALLRAIQRETDELDRLMRLLSERPDMDRADVQRRLEAFADGFAEYQQEGETLTDDPLSPLVPLAIGGAGLGALIERVTRPTDRVLLPRLDSGRISGLTGTLRSRMDELSAMMGNGELLADDWQERMARLITEAHTGYYRQTRGTLTPADETRLAARIREQLGYLDGFRADIEAGKLTPAQIQRRAQMYIDAGKASLQEGAALALGMPLLPIYPTQASECQVNCRCFWRIQTLEGNGNWNCTWVIQPSDVCPQCSARAAEWNPLQIRNGVIQPYNSTGLFI